MRRPAGSGERRLALRELSLTDPATVSLDQRSIVHLIERFIPTVAGIRLYKFIALKPTFFDAEL